ncbi:hypothetical protein AB8B21_22115 [Tardiphaga sp. 866_E4_N2_1]|jgi:hypothetical protein|uniref:hypothetical protein n=1 Tax=unclassified Tardiphaga TaxID=2631404 RepID=UPI003F2721C8
MLDDKIKTVCVDRLIFAPKLQAETSVVSLARQMFVARPALLRELPGVATLEEPDTNKDATFQRPGTTVSIDGSHPLQIMGGSFTAR